MWWFLSIFYNLLIWLSHNEETLGFILVGIWTTLFGIVAIVYHIENRRNKIGNK